MSSVIALVLGWGLSADDYPTRDLAARVAAVYLAFDSGAGRHLARHPDPEVRRQAADAAGHCHRRVVAARHQLYLSVDPVYAWVWGDDPAPTCARADRDELCRRLAAYARECGVTRHGEEWSFDPDGRRHRGLTELQLRDIPGIRSLRERVRGEPDSRTGLTDYPPLKPGYGPGLPSWRLP